MGQPPILCREMGVGVGRLRNEQKETRNAPEANIKPHKALKRRNEEIQRNEIKVRCVCQCNERYTDKQHKYRYVCMQCVGACIMQEERERRKRKKERERVQPRPLFLFIEDTTDPYFLSLGLCVWEDGK